LLTFVEKCRRRAGGGQLISFAVLKFDKALASCSWQELKERLRKFGLELAQDKTRVIPFSRYRQGEMSFEFLGFEFRWGVNRKGHAWLKRRTARKKFRQLTETSN
jgi:hypothetical protein